MEGAVDSAMNNKSSSGSMSQKEAREARRRKILERGSDRLAFITGEIKSVPPTSPSSQSRDFPAPVRTGDTGLKSLSSAEPRSADSPEGVSDLVGMPVISNLQPEVLALDTNARKLTSPTLEPTINPSLSTHKNDGITEDIAVALAALLLGFVKVASSEKKEEKTTGRGGLAVFRDVRFAQALAAGTQLEWALDLSLVAMKSCRSLFLDCCIYFVTLVSAASIVQFWLPSICKLLHH
ncbi:hypothetical protein CY35_01G024900 [Sphagnum magellanicum]|nr:hypothetical protein CY35_01G024900 [Sphagnum magellanicum]